MEFLRSKHVLYFKRCLKSYLPSRYASLDSNRMTLCFFALSGLDILNELHVLSNSDKADIIKWIYSLQIKQNMTGTNLPFCGFKGSTLTGSTETIHDCSHIAMTYTALLSLIILGDDLEAVDKMGVLKALKYLQMQDGSFCATYNGSENDMRFVYCAACICYILNDWSFIDVQEATKYILNSLTYEGAFAQGPGLEAHGGSTFCAIASLKLMDCFDHLSPKHIANLTRWCISRQIDGFNGRPGKPTDSCYSFWLGASLKLLDSFHLTNFSMNEEFLLSAQDNVIGGIAKWVDHSPDTLHTYFGICGLALIDAKLFNTTNSLYVDVNSIDEKNCIKSSTSNQMTSIGLNYIDINHEKQLANSSHDGNNCHLNEFICRNCYNEFLMNQCNNRLNFNDLSISNEISCAEKYALNMVHPALNVSIRAFNHLKHLHQLWS